MFAVLCLDMKLGEQGKPVLAKSEDTCLSAYDDEMNYYQAQPKTQFKLSWGYYGCTKAMHRGFLLMIVSSAASCGTISHFKPTLFPLGPCSHLAWA